MPRLPRIIVQTGGLGGGRLECDSERHWWCVTDYKQLGCLEKTPVGRCSDYEACKRAAAAIEKREQEEAAKSAAPSPDKKG